MLPLLKKIQPEWVLRLGLGLTFLYSGADLFYHPENWLGFIPVWFTESVGTILPAGVFLRVQGVGEFVLGLLFLAYCVLAIYNA